MNLVAPCGTGNCCDLGERPSCAVTPTCNQDEFRCIANCAGSQGSDDVCSKQTSRAACQENGQCAWWSRDPAKKGRQQRRNRNSASLAIIIPVVIAAVLLLAAILFLVRKRRVAARQPHRQSSMPTIGGDDEAEVEL